ncbi:hypothetical protein [Aquimarina aquimarini]|uniref:hypothetical protein n=1 Tax=Aquimarina aquimarini TaxID=1191734 RepID=UPI000D54F94D|nr:hypothetical protein [Aquimarina aquimarini]
MKKVFLSLSLLVAVLAVSCKGETKSNATEGSEKVEEVAAEETTEQAKEETTSEAASGVPTFSDKAVQEYVNSYEAYVEEYKKVAESKDMTAFASLGEKGQKLGQKAQEVMGNLSPEDGKKLSDYMTKKATQLQELSKKLMQ